MTRWGFAGAAAALALAVAAGAADAWKTITLRGEEGFTVSIPSAAQNEINTKRPDDLLFISVDAAMQGSLTCIAQRHDYPKGATRETFAAALKTDRREAFCGTEQAAEGSLSIGGSNSFERDGSQGAVCTASYTDKSAKTSPGRVDSNMVLAAPSGIYSMTCTVEDEDQEVAEYGWASFWGDKVKHIQDSFHLPKGR